MSVEIHGHCDGRFLAFKEAFRANFDAGLEVGASLAVTHRGKLVADLWGGFADAASTQPWQGDTIAPVSSTTKIMLMIAALVAIDRRIIHLDRTVAHYWPEFAQGGKGAVTVLDALTHRAGVPGLDPQMSSADACNWAAATARIAAEPHWFDGERRICYHALTYGFLNGEIIRRADGRGPRQFITEEVLSKAGADFLLGLPSPETLKRVAMPVLPPTGFNVGGIGQKLLNAIDRTETFSFARLSSENPGSVGFGNGRAIALACGIVANNGMLDGKRILSPEVIALAGTEQAYGPDPYLGMVRMGLGFGIDSAEYPAPTPTTMHWGGFGGSFGVMDPRAGASVGYVPNNWPAPQVGQDGQIVVPPRLKNLSAACAEVFPSL
jgi:CubicO group peptidase (beta-lactamase class C family)